MKVVIAIIVVYVIVSLLAGVVIAMKMTKNEELLEKSTTNCKNMERYLIAHKSELCPTDSYHSTDVDPISRFKTLTYTLYLEGYYAYVIMNGKFYYRKLDRVSYVIMHPSTLFLIDDDIYDKSVKLAIDKLKERKGEESIGLQIFDRCNAE